MRLADFYGGDELLDQRHATEFLQLVKVDVRADFDHFQPFRCHFQHGQVGVDAAYATDTGQRVGALGHELAFAGLGQVVHHHEHLAGARGEVHRTAYSRDRTFGAGVPVGQVALDRHLEGAQYGDVCFLGNLKFILPRQPLGPSPLLRCE